MTSCWWSSAEEQRACKNFLRMPPKMYDELIQRVGPRITKQGTWYREPLGPGLKIAITLRHIASGTKYAAMKFGWRVPHNTQSLAVRKVCHTIIDEYQDEAMTCSTTPEGWREISRPVHEEVELHTYMWCPRWQARFLQGSSKEWFRVL